MALGVVDTNLWVAQHPGFLLRLSHVHVVFMRICADMRMRLFYESLRTRLFPITFELRDTRYAMASSCSAAVLSRVGSREEAASDPRSQLCHQDSDRYEVYSYRRDLVTTLPPPFTGSVVREELDVLSNVYFEEMEVLLPDSR